MNLNLRDPNPSTIKAKRAQDMEKSELELSKAKIDIERLKWEKMDSESISIIVSIKYIGLALSLIVASLCLCEVGSKWANAFNPVTAEEVLKKVEKQIDKKLESIPVVKDSTINRKKWILKP